MTTCHTTTTVLNHKNPNPMTFSTDNSRISKNSRSKNGKNRLNVDNKFFNFSSDNKQKTTLSNENISYINNKRIEDISSSSVLEYDENIDHSMKVKIKTVVGGIEEVDLSSSEEKITRTGLLDSKNVEDISLSNNYNKNSSYQQESNIKCSLQDNIVMLDKSNLGKCALNNSWTLWAHLPQNIDNNWSAENYIKLMTVNTIEESVSLIKNIPAILISNCMLFVMKNNIRPLWEEVENRNGGCFSYIVGNQHVNNVWKNVYYMTLGRTISSSQSFNDDICGITISPKKNFCIIKIWMTNCKHQEPMAISKESGLSFEGCLFKKHM